MPIYALYMYKEQNKRTDVQRKVSVINISVSICLYTKQTDVLQNSTAVTIDM